LSKHGSFYGCISEVFPEYQWNQWTFSKVNDGFWNSQENAQKFTKSLAEKLGFKSMEDFYDLTPDIVIKYGGRTLLLKYNDCLSKMLENIYPYYDWHPWKFRRVPRDLFHPREMRIRFFQWFADSNGISNPDDWYMVKISQFIDSGGQSLLARNAMSLFDCLVEDFPEYDWKPWRFQSAPKGTWNNRTSSMVQFPLIGRIFF
jgi:hypothetical protein